MDINILLYDDFDTMEALGPAEVFGKRQQHFRIRYLSVSGDVINSEHGVKVWTDFLIPDEIEGILLIPGGKGARRLLWKDERTIYLIKRAVESADICMMVGNGTSLAAQTGLLYHRRIADYPLNENWNRMFTAEIERVKNMKIVMDGKYYSCSSTVAGLDLALWMVADQLDVDVAAEIADEIGYAWNPEESRDLCI